MLVVSCISCDADVADLKVQSEHRDHIFKYEIVASMIATSFEKVFVVVIVHSRFVGTRL